ncbi:MAG: type II toxin-antitoxin system VapC family toxin [Proteobacteria bacterium]|jgi:predicted nucleic-acid-binding protein|nr:type II toxin-antitoxin system VapC family toxin [Pseudomonadota bacterium]MDA1350662.1 type II toxin-antitoxin system VapC family toxin [Pseudomonadota bacterium]
MIALDTNVLLRYLLDDDKTQSAKARRIIGRHDEILLADAVLVETVWTLTGKRYGLDKDEICSVISHLFEEPAFFFEDDQTVWRALGDFRNAEPVTVGGKRKEADFADALIANKAQWIAANAGHSFQGLYSFDAAAGVLPNVKAP